MSGANDASKHGIGGFQTAYGTDADPKIRLIANLQLADPGWSKDRQPRPQPIGIVKIAESPRLNIHTGFFYRDLDHFVGC